MHRWKSLHNENNAVPTIFVYAIGLGSDQIEEMSHWDGVIYQDLRQSLPYAIDETRHRKLSMNIEKNEFDHLKRVLMAKLIRMFGHATYLQAGVIFETNFFQEMVTMLRVRGFLRVYDSEASMSRIENGRGMTEYGSIVLEGYIQSTSAAFKHYILDALQNGGNPFAKRSASIGSYKTMDQLGLSFKRHLKNQDSHTCHLKILPEAIHAYRWWNSNSGIAATTTYELTITVALGVLCTSKGTHRLSKHPLLRTFLPSLLKSLGRSEGHPIRKIVIYLGYDTGDRFFDTHGHLMRRHVYGIVKTFGHSATITTRWIRLARSGAAVAHLWNVLFETAVGMDNCTYFFQLNDDIRFIPTTNAWLDVFIQTLQDRGNEGVVGPLDPVFPNCTILTQVFLHGQTHRRRFGWLYPPEIRNWFCDSWITMVYGREGKMVCLRKVLQIRNGREGKGGRHPRYLPCKEVDYRALIDYYGDY